MERIKSWFYFMSGQKVFSVIALVLGALSAGCLALADPSELIEWGRKFCTSVAFFSVILAALSKGLPDRRSDAKWNALRSHAGEADVE